MTDSSCTHSILTTVLFSKSLPQLLHGQPATISAAVCSPLCVALNSKTRNLRDCGGEIRFRVSTNHTNSLQLKPEGKIAKANNILCTLQVILQLEMFLSLYQIRQPEDYLLFAYMDSFTFNFFFFKVSFLFVFKKLKYASEIIQPSTTRMFKILFSVTEKHKWASNSLHSDYHWYKYSSYCYSYPWNLIQLSCC